MSVTSIDVLPDGDIANSGGAILRLNGLKELPAKATLRLRPVGLDAAAPLPTGWPSADVTPKSARRTDNGYEVTVGPEAFKLPALKPGAAVAVVIPAANVNAQAHLPEQLLAGANSFLIGAQPKAHAAAPAKPVADRSIAKPAGIRNSLAADVKSVVRTESVDPATIGGRLRQFWPPAKIKSVALMPKPGPNDPGAPKKPEPSVKRRGPLLPFLAGSATTAAALIAVWALAQGPLGLLQSPTAGTATTGQTELSTILEVVGKSPLGVTSENIDLAEALSRADQSLVDTRDPQARLEAKYWLRKSLALGLDDERLTWAMAQLGTLYVTPKGAQPDYRAARLLWELAAANGDPIAQCFLGSLYEQGLGIAKDREKALAMFERAKTGGGCPEIDRTIARLKKAAS
jgi:hypothetical protein